MHPTAAKVAWNRTLMRADQAAKGWNDVALAAACRWPKKHGAAARVHQTSISRFMSGASHSPKLAKVIATALGQKVSRYVVVRPGGGVVTSPTHLALRAGICAACGCLVQQHFHPFTNVYRSCAYALRLNEQLRQSGSQPAREAQHQLEVVRGGRDGDGQRVIGGR